MHVYVYHDIYSHARLTTDIHLEYAKAQTNVMQGSNYYNVFTNGESVYTTTVCLELFCHQQKSMCVFID